MPKRAPSLCGCGKPIPAGQRCPCAATRKAEADKRRPSSADRGYDAAWRRVRSDFIKAHPVCCVDGCGKPATDVDHIESVRDRPDLRLRWSNLRPFCHPCHSRRTVRDQGFHAAPRGWVQTSPADGWTGVGQSLEIEQN